MINGIGQNDELYPPERGGKGRHRGAELSADQIAQEYKAKGGQHSLKAKPGDEHLRKEDRGLQKALGKNQGRELVDRFTRQSNHSGAK